MRPADVAITRALRIHIDRRALDESSKDGYQKAAGNFAVNCSSVAALAFLVYDFTLTFRYEVHYIWPTRRSLVKCIFLFIRYFTLVLQFSTQALNPPFVRYPRHGCYAWNIWQAIGSISIIASVDYILILRMYALYPRNKAVRYTLALLYAAEIVTLSIGMALAVPHLVFDEFCAVTDAPAIFLMAAGAPIAFQAVLFGATSWKFVMSVRSGWGDVPIVRLVMRDGTWAFTLLFLVLLSEAAIYGLAAESYTGVLYNWLNTIFAFCGYRVILNLSKEGGTRNDNTTDTYEMTGPNVEFTSNIYTNGGIQSQPPRRTQILVPVDN